MKSSPDPCPGLERLQLFRLGKLQDEDLDWIEGHLNQCPECVETLTASVDAADLLADAVRAGIRAGPLAREEHEESLLERVRALWTPPEFSQGDTLADDVEGLPDVPGYEILHRLGRGGMGIVFKARHRELGRIVALKMLSPIGASGKIHRTRFLTEARTIAALRHPSIVQIYDIGTHAGRPFFTMEYLEGGTLAKRLDGKPLPTALAAQLVMTLALAVQAAHARGIIHRDLKPANVLLSSANANATTLAHEAASRVASAAKVADFGLAKCLATDAAALETQAGEILGTPSYMAPEQAQGGRAGHGADIYALGAILYECLTGRPPFLAATVLETLEQTRRLEPLPPSRLQPGVPRDLETICLKCLEKSPQRRYATAQALADDLNRFLAGEPIVARPARRIERIAKWSRRQPALAAFVLVSILFLVCTIGGGIGHYASMSSALKRAEVGEAAARDQRERTAEQYRQARATIRRIFSQLVERELLNIPQVVDLQRAQAEAALAFFEKMVADQENPGPEVERDLGLTCGMVGHYQLQVGLTESAEKSLRRAVALLEPLVQSQPDDFEARGILASSCTYLGSITTARDPLDAERWLVRAQEMHEALARDDAGNPAHRDGVAENLHNLAFLYGATQRPAVAFYEKAVAVRRERIDQEPQVGKHRLALAEHLLNLWQAYSRAQQPAKGIAALQEAADILEPIAKAHSNVPRVGASLSRVHINFGATWLSQGQPAKALEAYTRGLNELQRVLAREPNYGMARQLLVPGHGGRAQCLTALFRFKDALPEWDKIIELADDATRPLYQLERAFHWLRLGDHEKGSAEADAVVRAGPPSAHHKYLAARVFGRSARMASADARRADAYAARALALLTEAHREDYFATEAKVAQLKKDLDFSALRARPDFQEFVRTLEAVK